MASDRWPELPYAAWQDTRDTLQLWTQIVGKVRLALTPWLNHSWHVALYVTARGLTHAADRPAGGAISQIEFDFIDHVLWLRTSDGHFRQLMLRPMSVAEFYADVMIALRELGIDVRINEMPNEIPDAMPFPEDRRARRLRPRLRRAASGGCCCARTRCSAHFRTGFLGKASPVHFFWGSFDLAVTRFSGRRAPPHPGGVPHLPDAVAREAYSHEVSSAGFWPGGGGDRLSGVLFLRLSGAGGLCRGEGEARRGVLVEGTRRIHPAVRRGADRAPIRSAALMDVPAKHL